MASNIYYDYNNVSSFHMGTYQIEGNMKYPTTSASLILCACFPEKKKKRKQKAYMRSQHRDWKNSPSQESQAQHSNLCKESFQIINPN